jgi:putative transposase
VKCFRFIAAAEAHHAIATLCRVLGVSRAGYYAWRVRQPERGGAPSARARADGALLPHLHQIHRTSRGTYGAPRVHAELTDPEGAYRLRCGRKRVARLMRQAGLAGCHRRPHQPRTTTPDRGATPAPDRVERAFAPEQIGAPDKVWVADITYVPTDEGWLYLATVLDAFSRRCIGWSMADHLRTELVLDAIELALARRRPAQDGGLVHHSDHGCQYTSLAFGQRLQAAGIGASMGSVGDCYDNAVAESFFATLKGELLDRQSWPTRAAARSAIFEYLEVWYNRQRRHSTLGYVSPATFEARHQRRAASAGQPREDEVAHAVA